jgi:hypothetical protein
MRLPNERADTAFQLVCQIDIDPGACIRFFHVIRCRATAPVANRFRQAKRLPYNSFQIGKQRGLRFLVG